MIEINHLVKKYGDHIAVNDLTLTVEPGKIYGFLGPNGAGKTTLIKLIMRLYDPTEGEILINGINIRKYDAETYRRLFQVVFQDFQLYAFSLASNIMMRNTSAADDDIIDDALDRSDLAEFKELKERNLTKEFDGDGLVPSGGQAQKIAIARALAANCGKIVIMDEASSALDPASEYAVNKSVFDNSSGKSMIIISHRLSTVQYADRIYYLSEGRVTECGTHEELIGLQGEYCSMYEKQAESYRI